MTIHAFLGPSLAEDVAVALLPGLVCHPPVRCGDVVRLLAMDPDELPTAIVIVDGYFHQTAAVWHKEILFALSCGVPVYGASSMGALRAAELEAFGMVPHGRIAAAFCTERFDPFPEIFDRDDEVAVNHGPRELGYPSSLALVDARWRLAQLLSDGWFDVSDALSVIAPFQKLGYADRTEAAFGDCIAGAERSLGLDHGRLSQAVAETSQSLKRDDAISLFSLLASEDVNPPDAAFRFEVTQNWERLLAVMIENQ